MNSPCISCLFILISHNPRARLRDLVFCSTSLLLKYRLKHCFSFQDASPRPHSDRGIVPEWLCAPSHLQGEFSCVRGCWFSVLHRKVSLEQGELNCRVLSVLRLSLINTSWQIDLTFDCEVRVETCVLTFCLERGSFQNERSILPKWHFNQKWCEMNVNFILLLRIL